VSGVFTTRVSGATITGTTAQFTSGTFVSLTGTTITGTTISGTTVSSTTGTFTSLTGTTITGTTVNGTTVNSITGNFTSLTGVTVTGTTARFTSGVFTTQVSGLTVTGTQSSFTSGNFVTLSGATATFTSGVIASGTAAAPSLSILGDPNTGIYSPGADQVAISTNGTGRLFVASDGKVSHNHSGAVATNPFSFAHVPRLVTTSTETSNYQGLASIAYNGSVAGLWLGRSAGTTVNTFNALTSGNDIGGISFAGADGTAFINAARIRCIVDGAVSTNTVPGALLFATSSTGSAPTERMRLDSTGRLGLGTSSPVNRLHTQSTVDGEGISIAHQNTPVGGQGPALTFRHSTNSGPQQDFSYVKSLTASGDNALWGGHLAFGTSVNGTLAERVRILNGGNVGIGTTSPAVKFQVSESSAGSVEVARFRIEGQTNNPMLRIFADEAGQTVSLDTSGTTVGTQLVFREGGSEAARIDSSGRLLVGTSSALALNNVTAGIELHSTSTNNGASFSIARFNNDAGGPQLILGKSRNATVAAGTIVQANDDLGQLVFNADDGTDLTTPAARISCFVDGTPGADDMPGRLVFSTTADGAGSATEGLRLTNDNVIAYNQAAPATVNTSATITAANLKTGIITSTTAAAVTMTLPTSTNIELGFSGIYTNMTFEFSVINTGPNTLTVGANGNTTVGSLTVATGTSARYALRRTGTNSFTLYRLS
jgi:hypothetical protein